MERFFLTAGSFSNAWRFDKSDIFGNFRVFPGFIPNGGRLSHRRASIACDVRIAEKSSTNWSVHESFNQRRLLAVHALLNLYACCRKYKIFASTANKKCKKRDNKRTCTTCNHDV